MEPSRCYTEGELRAFVLGKLPDEQCQAIAGHLEQCPTCEATAERLDGEADRVICDLRQAVSPAAATPPERPSAPSTPAATVLDSSPGAPGDDPDRLPALPGYETLEELGRGGMGIVYKAWQRGLRRLVAVKMLPDCAPPELRARFQVEGEAAARLQHPNIVAVHEVGGDSRRPFLVMEFLEGGSLASKLAGAPLPAREAARLVELLARAVEYAHGRQVLHRDLKPANVLLSADGTPKVADFGLARLLAGGADLTRTGAILGTPSYMAPEQARSGTCPVGPAVDVYALGSILYECLTGRPPFKGVTDLDTLGQVAEVDPVPPRQLQPGVPRDLDTICLKCLHKDPAGRYRSSAELADDLGRYLAGEPIRARPVGSLERGLNWARRRPALAGLGAAVVVLAVGLAVGGVWARQQAVGRRTAVEAARADAAIRQAAAEEALAEAHGHRQASRWAKVRAALERARGHLAGGGPADLRERIEQAARDADVVAAVDEVRLRQADIKNERFDTGNADKGYAAAFRAYGVDVDGPNPDEAADLLRDSAVREQLVAALDHWWTVRRLEGDLRGADRLRAVADRVDGEPWRAELRAAMADGDLDRLKGLAGRAAGQPSAVQSVLALALRSRKALREAEEVLRRGLTEHPDDLWLADGMGFVLVARKQWGEAEGFFRLAVGLRPDSPGVWGNLGNCLREQGRLDEAVACHRTAVRLDSNFAKAHTNLGIDLSRQGKREEAVACHRRAIELDPKLALAHTNLGLAQADQGQLEEAVASYRRALSLDPQFAGTHESLGKALYQQGKRDEAVACFRRAIQLDPNYAPAHTGLGITLDDEGKGDEAVACYRLAIQLDPKDGRTWYNLGNTLYRQKKLTDAVASFRQSIQLDPKFPSAHHNLGVVLADQGKLDEAVACYRQAIRLEPMFAPTWFNLGLTLHRQGKVDEAAECFRQAVRLDPKDAQAHYNLGNILDDQGKLDEAAACFRQALSVDPNYVEAHSNLGFVLLKQRKWDEAVACFRRAIRLSPEFPAAHCNLGLALRELGRFREALEAMEKGHQLGSRSPNWNFPSAARVRECRLLVELEPRLSAVLEGTDRPTNAERLVFVRLCQYTRRFAAAARLYADAFASQPQLVAELRARHRYDAACFAARAGCGQGVDAAELTGAERLRWRRQALTWLRDELAAWERQLPAGAAAREGVVLVLRHWQANPDLSGLREPPLLARLPAEERGACERLWADVAVLLRRSEAPK
jgi:serine/threonine-protein kinase